ncbi:MAG: hypothetical protein WCH75_01905 [Candidatus Binatia bacterium]
MEPYPFRFHIAERANNHVEQGDTFFFAHNPIGITYNRVAAMFTNAIHVCSSGKEHAIVVKFVQLAAESSALQQNFYLEP